MNREGIRQRASHRCEYCRTPEEFSLATFHIEHIIARQHGGSDDDSNLALACPDCNFLKGPNIASFDPDTQKMERLFHPRTDVWAAHFRLNESVIEGVTPIGRTTVRLLELNAAARVRQRDLLRRLGR